MNEQYNRFEDQYLDQEPAIILDQNQQAGQRPEYYDSYQEQHQHQQAQQQPQAHQQLHQDNEHNIQQQGVQQSPQIQDQQDEEQIPQDVEGEAEDFMGDSVFSNVGQGLTGNYRNMMMAYWQETINNIEHEEHDFKNHQLPLARIKKVMKTDEEVRMISAEAPILFAKGCDIFITELTMRAWIHAEENKRRTLQRSDIAAALQKSDMFDFLIDIVPREEATGANNVNNSTKKSASRQNSTTGFASGIGSNNDNTPSTSSVGVGGGSSAGNGNSSNNNNNSNNTGSDFQQQYLQQQLLQQQFLNSKNDDDDDEPRDDSNYQYNDMNVYDNRY